jgi:hypothetical protein
MEDSVKNSERLVHGSMGVQWDESHSGDLRNLT